jgi:hypothetical protein
MLRNECDNATDAATCCNVSRRSKRKRFSRAPTKCDSDSVADAR